MNNVTALLAALMLGATPLCIHAEPPTDEEIAAALSTYTEKTKELSRSDREGRQAAAKEVAGSFNIAELSLDHLQRLERAGILAALDKRDEVFSRLNKLAAGADAQAARAAIMAVNYTPITSTGLEGEEADAARQRDNRLRAAAAVATLKHPGLPEALQASQGLELLQHLSPYSADTLVGLEREILAFERLLTDDLPAAILPRIAGLFDVVASDKLSFEPGAQERIRTRLLTLINTALKDLPEDDRAFAGLDRSRNYLQGAYARGQLVNHTAPELDIFWTSAPQPIASLADLRGKVVVLDFWATWCGPCIASFPNVRELVAHYEGYPVVILGITSIQGSHINHKAEDPKDRRIDTKGDPDKELALMPEFIQQMEITWPIAFARQDVFNPDYGVRGIPHVAILDPKGVVRYRGLHPALPSEGDKPSLTQEERSRLSKQQKIAKINSLLREAGLPVPPETDTAAEPKKAGTN